MTEDYKSKLIKYLTGNMSNETGTNEPQFIEAGYVNSNIKNYINNYFENGAGSYGTLTVENSDYYINYGYYYYDEDQTDMRGFILIVSTKHEPIQMITQYDSGTNFRPFKDLNVDENGYIYGVDMEYFADGGPTGYLVFGNYRFIMLNKILFSNTNTGTFFVKLRRSYFFPSNYSSTVVNVEYCTHQINTSNYFIFIGTDNNNFGILSLTINVGQENNWTLTTTNLIWFHNTIYFNDYRDENFKIIISGTKDISSKSYNYREIVYEFKETPTITQLNTINAPDFSTTDYRLTSMVRTNYQDTYVIYIESTTTDNIHIYKINYSTNTMEEIGNFQLPIGYDSAIFKKKGTLPFFKVYWRVEEDGAYVYKSYLGVIIGKNLYYISLADVSNENFSSNFLIKKNYNLYEIYNDSNNNQTQKIQLIYNENNYNGFPYEAPNCLVPNSSVLYDADDNIIFARNLYNKTVLGATTTSTVQIPNTMLNDVTIGKSDLISETNLPLTEDTTDITKNIYETVNINFANNISIRNDNDPNNTILNPTASARLNGATTQNNNYDDVKATKVRVNYVDGTNMIIALNPQKQLKMMSKQVARYQFIIYVDRQIENLQIISFDENTVYQTITTLNLELNKTYMITQYVSIGESIQKNDIFYNNNQIYYNGESINYIN